MSIKYITLLLCLFCISCTEINTTTTASNNNIEHGKSLFLEHCASCHHKDLITDSTGPPLGKTILQRDKDWWIKATQNFEELLLQGDSLALALYEAYDLATMSKFDLTAEQVSDIYDYVKWRIENGK